MALLLLLLVVVMPVAVVAMVIAWRNRANVATGDAPECGRCGYNVTGLTTDICPECGSDLKVVGIRRPGMRRPLSPSQRLAIWAVGGAVPAILVGHAVAYFLLPVPIVTTRQRVFFNHLPGAPAIVMARSTSAAEWGPPRAFRGAPTVDPPSAHITLAVQNVGSSNVLTVDRAAGGYRFVDATGTTVARAGTIDADAVATWFAAFAPATDKTAATAGRLLESVAEMDVPAGADFHWFRTVGEVQGIAHPTWTRREAAGFGAAVPYAVAAIAWTSIAVLIARRSRAS